ncbi:MAG TPA: SDR family NAD(P)-dependent oxidoreductase, partial [Dehalococcoidia bacterium]|nr:SDR family NAD(P)-dependent oxidoreductase [Dehalococcoidia bacterium]
MTEGKRTAVVTGASSGIGAATARALHEAGFDVIGGARRLEQ